MRRSASKKGGSIMKNNSPRQRKTTLKWNSDGELTAIDKARILERLTNKELTECELSCNALSTLKNKK
ncbi:hypothetical protein EV04_1355 [Prochlorococcus marinus str. LG]|nr:hypothetical protein EV04_1355 [Prochlorococcus marinus str. LG]